MPRKKQSSTDKKQSSSRKANSPAEKQAARQLSSSGGASSRARLLDDRARRDIWGVICAVLAIILFIIAIMSPSGILTTWLSNIIHVGLGKGAFILPFVMILISATFFAKPDGQEVPVRVAVGLLLLYLALLVLLALYTPGVSSQTLEPLFARANLVNQGGYIGAAIAWVLTLLMGQMVSTVLTVGLMLVALVIIGFSFRGLIEKLLTKRDELFDSSWESSMPRMSLPLPSARQSRYEEEDGYDESEASTIQLDGEESPQSGAMTRKLTSSKKKKDAAEAETIALEPAKAEKNVVTDRKSVV